MHDVNTGLPYGNSSFDVVNGRFLAGGITNYLATIREIYRVLRDTGNGWIQLTELRPFLRCDDQSIPCDAACISWHDSFFRGPAGSALGTADFDSIAINLRSMVENAGFVDVREYIDKAPVGGWDSG